MASQYNPINEDELSAAAGLAFEELENRHRDNKPMLTHMSLIQIMHRDLDIPLKDARSAVKIMEDIYKPELHQMNYIVNGIRV